MNALRTLRLTIDGRECTRRTRHDYTHVVVGPRLSPTRDGTRAVWSWHRTAEAADTQVKTFRHRLPELAFTIESIPSDLAKPERGA